MLRKSVNAIAVLLMVTNPVTAKAGPQGGPQYPGGTGCPRVLIREIIDAQNSHYADLVRQHIEERKKVPAGERKDYDKKFCDNLRSNWDNGRAEGRYECMARDCQPDTPVTQDVRPHREIVEHVTRPASRRPAPPPEEDAPAPVQRETSGGGLMSSPFMGALLGGALGGFLGGYLGGRMGGQQQQRPMFPPPQWGGQWGQPGMMGGMQPPGILPYGGGAPQVLPYGGAGGFNSPYALPYGQTQPWAQPYMGGVNQFAGGYNQYGAGQYGGGYRGVAPGVLPLAPQPYSPYSVGGAIPQNHWNLINVGR